jgi:hypothetical protein
VPEVALISRVKISINLWDVKWEGQEVQYLLDDWLIIFSEWAVLIVASSGISAIALIVGTLVVLVDRHGDRSSGSGG